MSYDLYCYRPSSDVVNLAEAEAFIDQFNAAEENGEHHNDSSQLREDIVAALVQHNPRLERFSFDYGKIAESLKTSVEEARARFQHVELNPPEGDLAIQLIVHGDLVTINVPYWYSDNRADEVFSTLNAYLRVIRKTAGLFVYDPQTGVAFDPAVTPLNVRQYDETMREIPKIAAAAKTKKPWWKFWPQGS